MAASGSRVGLRWCDSEVECLLEIWADDSIHVVVLHCCYGGEDAWWWRIYRVTTWWRMYEGAIVPRPRPLGAVWPRASGGSGGIVLNLPAARNRQTCLVWVRPEAALTLGIKTVVCMVKVVCVDVNSLWAEEIGFTEMIRIRVNIKYWNNPYCF